MKKYNKKISTNITLLGVLTFLLLIAVSCKSSSKKQDTNMSELSEEVQDVNEELNEIIIAEKKELKSEIDSIVSDFNKKTAMIEQKIGKSKKELNSESKEILKKLKAERDSLSLQLGEIENQTEKDWNAFKKEVKHDTKQFESSVEDFFKDNV